MLIDSIKSSIGGCHRCAVEQAAAAQAGIQPHVQLIRVLSYQTMRDYERNNERL